MKGKTVVITGANRGIGFATASALAGEGARVVMVCRDEAKGTAAVEALRDQGADAELVVADLASLTQVREAARAIREQHPRIDVLIANAGMMSPERRLTEDNLEESFAVNFLSHFVLTIELIEPLRAAGTHDRTARVINVASEAHRDGYMRWHDLRFKQNFTPERAYAMAMLSKCLFTRELARRLRGENVTATALHPGRVATGFGITPTGWRGVLHRLGKPLQLAPAQGARTAVWLATSPEVEGVSGEYFVGCKRVRMSGFALDEGLSRRIWTVSEHLAGIRLMQFAA